MIRSRSLIANTQHQQPPTSFEARSKRIASFPFKVKVTPSSSHKRFRIHSCANLAFALEVSPRLTSRRLDRLSERSQLY